MRGISSRMHLAVLYFCIRVACFPHHIRIMDCSLLCCAWRCRFTLPQGMSIGSAINNVHSVTPDSCATRADEGSSDSSNSRSPMAGLKACLATRLNMLAIQKSKMYGDWQVTLDADGDHLVYFNSEFPDEKLYSNPLLSCASLKRHMQQVNGETVRYLSSETAMKHDDREICSGSRWSREAISQVLCEAGRWQLTSAMEEQQFPGMPAPECTCDGCMALGRVPPVLFGNLLEPRHDLLLQVVNCGARRHEERDDAR